MGTHNFPLQHPLCRVKALGYCQHLTRAQEPRSPPGAGSSELAEKACWGGEEGSLVAQHGAGPWRKRRSVAEGEGSVTKGGSPDLCCFASLLLVWLIRMAAALVWGRHRKCTGSAQL